MADMDALALSVLVAGLGYVLESLFQFFMTTYLDRTDQIKEKRRIRNEHALARIDYQLTEVFGPLQGILLCSKSSFTMLGLRHNLEANALIDEVVKKTETPSEIQKDYMLWIEHILQPCNRKVTDIIIHRSHGFDHIPGYFANITAHCEETEVILVKWNEKNYSHMVATIPFDDRINGFVEAETKRLREQKMVILDAMEIKHNISLAENDYDDQGICLKGEERGKKGERMLHGKQFSTIGKSVNKIAPTDEEV